MNESWKRWEGQLVGGKFPLLRFLGGSEHGGIFLVDTGAGGKVQTAVKFVPAASVDANEQLRQWKVAATLDHPNVIRVFESGRCDLGGTDFLYVLTEYAEEDLSQILPQRALTDEETRQVLDAVLDGLTYIHGKGLVHGRVRPSNILAAGDEVKISSDSLRAAGEGRRWGEQSVYDAPETARGQLEPRADVWSLGVTLVEMLTQRLPGVDSGLGKPMVLPEGIPQSFREIVEDCLQIDATKRRTVAQIAARLDTGRGEAAEAQALPSDPATSAGWVAAAPLFSDLSGEKRSAKWAYALAFVAVVLIAGVVVLKPKAPVPSSEARTGVPALHQDGAASGTAERPPSAVQTEPEEARSDQGSKDEMLTKAGTRGGVAIRVIPRVSTRARRTIRGRIRVAVKVDVDAAGNVTQARLQSGRASKYFARLALEAARGWKFKPVRANGGAVASEWVVRFSFSRRGTEGSARRTT